MCTKSIGEIRRLIEEARERWQIPGVTVAVATPTADLWSEGFGQADVENDVPATAKTIYRIASITKPMTATAVMQLSERGELDLDAPIQAYVPTFPEKPWLITARLLIAHLAGVRDFEGDEGQNATHYPYGSVPLTHFLDGFKDASLLHEPGTRFRYSTYGYNLLGCAIEAASGTDYLTFVRKNIFAPAGMADIYPGDPVDVPDRACGYALREDGSGICPAKVADLSDHLPGGGFCATAEAVVRFGAALQSGLLLQPETLHEMFTRQRTKGGQDTRFGLGWFPWTHHGEREVAHGGKHHGASTMLYLRPDSGIAVGLLTNLQAVPAPYLHGLAQRIADGLSTTEPSSLLSPPRP